MQLLEIKRLRRALDNNYVLVLTTNSTERTVMSERLTASAKAMVPADNDGARIGLCGDQIVLHVTGTSGGQADKSVGRIARKIIANHQLPRPKAVVLAGIAWGAPTIVPLGNVVLSGKIIAINQIRFHEDQDRRVGIERTSPWFEELDSLVEEIADPDLPLQSGVLVSGEQFFARDEVRDAVLASFPGIAGGEMEGWDLVPDLEDLPWLQVRGISDFAGNATDRSDQALAARNATGYVDPLLRELAVRGRLTPIRRDPATVSLLEVLSGNQLEITRPNDGTTLDNHLNYQAGPGLVWRLTQYSPGVASSSSLARHLANLLLELAQNALRHGGGHRVAVQFNAGSLTYVDDGRAFDLFSLLSHPQGRGGCRALSAVQDVLVKSNAVELAVETPRAGENNRYRISFPMLTARFRDARDKCGVEIAFDDDPIDIEFCEKFEFDHRCQTLFFDVSDLLMYSRRIDVVGGLRSMLEMGKELFIQCGDEHEKTFYEDALSDLAGDRLSVFVVPPVAAPATY